MATTTQPKTKITDAMRKELQLLFEVFLDVPFRRSDLSLRMKRFSRSGSKVSPDDIADAVMKEAAKAGQIARQGHLHWVRVSMSPGGRKLKSGRLVAEHKSTVKLTIDTHVPTKYVVVDLETGDIWEGSPRGDLTRASRSTVHEAVEVLAPTKKVKA